MKLTLIVAALAATSMMQTAITSWSFDSDTVGRIGAGLTNEIGTWIVVADTTAPSKPNVLAQNARSSGPTFNVALINNTNFKDLDLSVSMRSVAGSTDQGGGVIWRAKDARNYYVARYNPLEENYRVYKVENGRRQEFKSADIPAAAGWHTLRVTMAGDHIECYYDGKKYLDVRDNTFGSAGKIGLWTKADAQTRFDDLKVIPR